MVMALGVGLTAIRAEPAATGPETYFIREYRIEGAHKLSRRKIEEAVYRFLGPGRTQDDVEQARAALEQAYAASGLQTAAVQIPPQQVTHGVVHLQVVERTVGRLRVRGARYSSPAKIKSMAPSLAEGRVIDFTAVPQDIIALNQSPDRQVTPSLRAGVEPDTVDVDLEVKEKAPVHASVELNNRHGANTTPLRLNASVSDNNLGQTGHGLGLSFQTSPQNTSEVKVFSGYYLARFTRPDWLNLMVQATKQDSNVSTLGSTAVAGRGETAGLRALFTLPAEKEFTQSASVGLDYKHFDQKVALAATGTSPAAIILTPITYYPLSASYGATWQKPHSTTEFNAGLGFNIRGLGSNSAQFGDNRYNADGNFLIFHGDLSHTHDLPHGLQLFGKIQGQIADQPLLSGEQASGGGVGTARGYLEAEQVGDNALFGTLELRSPSLANSIGGKKGEWRVFGFTDAGWLKVNEPLPGQKNHFDFLSLGIGSQLRLLDHFEGSIIAALPLLAQGQTPANSLRILFRGALDY
ncbi:MAG: Hemolysin activation/secretion protein [Verrucomicrobia bacterium]|nr:MAG: Hemolysin activation/secretion protein [Verrucomicrobiota bacterium]